MPSLQKSQPVMDCVAARQRSCHPDCFSKRIKHNVRRCEAEFVPLEQ
jgi:hypothetical protein